MFTQVFINWIIATGSYVLLGIGFHLMTKTTRFFNFAYAFLITSGAYSFFAFLHLLKMPIILSIVFGIVISTTFGCTLQGIVFGRLSRAKASGTIKMICSIGIYIALQNVISLAFGDETKGISFPGGVKGFDIWFTHVTMVQLLTVILGGATWLSVCLFLKITRLGAAIRAVASDPELSEAYGVRKDKISLFAVAIGSVIASISGILIACDVGMNPTMGMNAFMISFIVVIVGGLETISGVALGALLIALAQNLGIFFLSSRWQDTIAFVMLLGFLAIRPQGFSGKKAIKAIV
jgi:branched-chain amino acid transport system permease protein